MLPLPRICALPRNRRNLANSETTIPLNFGKGLAHKSFIQVLRDKSRDWPVHLHVSKQHPPSPGQRSEKKCSQYRPGRPRCRGPRVPAASTPPTPRTSSAQSPMPTPHLSLARGRVPPPSIDQKSLLVSRTHWRSASRLWRSSRRCRLVALYGRCAPSLAVSPNGCEW